MFTLPSSLSCWEIDRDGARNLAGPGPNCCRKLARVLDGVFRSPDKEDRQHDAGPIKIARTPVRVQQLGHIPLNLRDIGGPGWEADAKSQEPVHGEIVRQLPRTPHMKR